MVRSFVALSLLFCVSPLFSQELLEFPVASFTLEMGEGPGRNGTAVVYNPDDDIYYAAFAGNADFPIAVFRSNGSKIMETRIGNDIRGLWWNEKSGTLEANCYGETGWVQIGLDPQGLPGEGNRILVGGSNQPFGQAVGVFDPKRKEVLFYENGIILGYRAKNGEPSKKITRLRIPKGAGSLNEYSLMFTGKKGKELMLIDSRSAKAFLFDRKTGAHSGTVSLPSSAYVEPRFNVSYANNYLFLFNIEERIWTGYQIFK